MDPIDNYSAVYAIVAQFVANRLIIRLKIKKWCGKFLSWPESSLSRLKIKICSLSLYLIAEIPSMHNHTFVPQGIMHYALFLMPLQKVGIKEWEVPPNIAPKTDTYINDTNKATNGDKYPWSDADYKQ